MTSSRPTTMLPPPPAVVILPPEPPADTARRASRLRRLAAAIEALSAHAPADTVAVVALDRALDELEYHTQRAALHLGLVRAGGA